MYYKPIDFNEYQIDTLICLYVLSNKNLFSENEVDYLRNSIEIAKKSVLTWEKRNLLCKNYKIVKRIKRSIRNRLRTKLISLPLFTKDGKYAFFSYDAYNSESISVFQKKGNKWILFTYLGFTQLGS